MKDDAIKIGAIRKIKKCAEQCNGYLKLEELNRERLCDFVCLCLRVKKDELNKELVNYLHKTCFGIPKFVQYTLFYLLTKKYIKLYRYACGVRESEPVSEAPNQRDTSIGDRGTEEHSRNSGFSSNRENGLLRKEDFSSVSSTINAGSTSLHDPTSYTYINEETKQIITQQNGFQNFQFCEETEYDDNRSDDNVSYNELRSNDSRDKQLRINRDASLTGPISMEKDNPTGTHQKGCKYTIKVVRDLNSAPLVPRLVSGSHPPRVSTRTYICEFPSECILHQAKFFTYMSMKSFTCLLAK